MDNSALNSTFALTILLMIGLFFFIRGSIKDRTEQVKLVTEQPESAILPQLQQYFDSRSYRVVRVENQVVTFEGFVPPSLFLAIFLSFLAALGLFSLALVLSYLFPDYSQFTLFVIILSPLAGLFYWNKSGRTEQVLLKIEPVSVNKTTVTVRAHRDELIAMEQSLQWEIDD
jgi:Cofactor assembly of complex C subunit B